MSIYKTKWNLLQNANGEFDSTATIMAEIVCFKLHFNCLQLTNAKSQKK